MAYSETMGTCTLCGHRFFDVEGHPHLCRRCRLAEGAQRAEALATTLRHQ